MPDPIHIQSRSAGRHWPEVGWMIFAHCLTSGPDPFGQNLTQSANTKLDPSWFCTILSWMCVEEWNQVWKWETGSGLIASCQKPGPMIPAHQLASRLNMFGQTLTRPSRSEPGLFCTIWPLPSLEKWNWNGCGKLDLAYDMLAIMAITGRNQNASVLDLACLLGMLSACCVDCCYLFLCLCQPEFKHQWKSGLPIFHILGGGLNLSYNLKGYYHFSGGQTTRTSHICCVEYHIIESILYTISYLG